MNLFSPPFLNSIFYKIIIDFISMQEPNYVEFICSELNLKKSQVENVLKLIEELNTVPFIARYRKEVTGNLDENVIRAIVDIREKQINLFKAKESALKNIEEQDKLTKELEDSIIKAKTLKEVEDLYAPYKRKKKTKAMIAIEKGFDPIARQIFNQEDIQISSTLLSKYSKEEILEGARDIVIQEIVDDAKNRQAMRYYFNKYGEITSEYKKKLEELPEKTQKQVHKFEIYDGFSGAVSKLKSYQILALNRGEDLGILNVKLEKDDISYEGLEEKIILKTTNTTDLKFCVKEGFKKIFTSIETEIRNLLTEQAEEDAIKSFQKNLKNLLMTKPQYGDTVLAIDPGYRTGCKIAVIDKEMKPLEFSKVFIERQNDAIVILKRFVQKYSPETIVIGNGTGSNEIFDIVKTNLGIVPVIVSESGASVYSASDAGNEEFPNLDATNRGTISIGRRFIDPLAELVKIPPHNIGVGMYQHDMNQKELEKKLGFVVEDVVNLVGVNVNTASVYVLSHISGLNKRSAKKIVDNQPYKSRKELSKVTSKKIFEQCAGFLRVPESKEKFDNTNIHPEQYKLAEFVIKDGVSASNFDLKKADLVKLYSDVSLITVADILKAYENIGEDPRVHSGNLKLDKTLSIEELKEGEIVKGIVRNIMQFGAFVDIGLKNDGLIHISQLANKFVKDPNEVVQIGEEVRVKVIGIDLKNGKVQLSLKDLD